MSSNAIVDDGASVSRIAILCRWKEVQHIHSYIEKNAPKASGSMESALFQAANGESYVTSSSFVLGVLSEYGLRAPTICIEKHLLSFYATFPKSKKGQVDWRLLLCTYLCIVWKRAIFESTMNVLHKFCAIYIDSTVGSNSDSIRLNDLLSIISIGAVTDKDFRDGREKLQSTLLQHNCVRRDDTITKEAMDRVLSELYPGILIQFRDQIMDRLDVGQHFDLLVAQENQSMNSYDEINRRLMLKAALKLWTGTLLNKMFHHWATYTKAQTQHRIIATRMLYWKSMKLLGSWKEFAMRSSLLAAREATVPNLDTYRFVKGEKVPKLITRVLTKYFHLWLRYTRTQQKIKKACMFQDDVYKSLSLGLTFLRQFIKKHTKRQAFRTWTEALLMKKKLSLAATLRLSNMQKVPFLAWARFAMQERKRRYSEFQYQKHKSRVSTYIQELLPTET